LIVLRFLQAVGGAAAAVLSRAIVRDVFAPPEVPRVLSLMQLVSMLAVMVAPLLGSYILSIGSWRWIFGLLAVFSVITGLMVWWKIPETHEQENRADSLRATFLSYWHIYTDPKGLGYVLMMALCFSGMFAYITVSPFVFIEFYGLTTFQFSLIFAVNSFGIMLLSMLNARLVRAYGSQTMLRLGSFICLLSGVLLLTSAWLDNHFWLLMLGLFGAVSCVGLIGANATASLMQLYPRSAGAAAGLTVASQFGIGAVIAMGASAMYDGTPLSMILVVALCGLAVPLCYQLTRLQA
jgi:DHA1 family bicyclomycin/chloramphenicol resistance-like MFS transporter